MHRNQASRRRQARTPADRRYVRFAVAFLLIAFGVFGLATMPGAPGVLRASAAAGLAGVADASGVRVTYTIPNFLVLTTIVDGGGPVAQSSLDDSGNADGYASMPYPGNTVVTAPGLVDVLFGASVPISYPLYAEATYPLTPTASAHDATGTLSMSADASTSAVHAAAALAGSTGNLKPSGSTSTTSVTLDDSGDMVVTADSSTAGLTFGDSLLSIGEVHSHSVTTYAAGDKGAKTVSTCQVTGVSVAGVPVTIGPKGVEVSGSTTGLSAGLLTTILNSTLGAAGISVHTTASSLIAGGSGTSALEIDSAQALPLPTRPKGTLVFTIGAASSSITFGHLGPVASTLANTSGGQSVVSPPVATGVVGGSGGVGSLPSATTGGTAPAPASPAGGSPASPQVGSRPSSVLIAVDLRHTVRLFYLVLAVGGALLLASTSLWQRKGVHASWMS